MALSRNTILNALFTRLQGIEGIRTVSRKLKSPDQVSPAEQPALFLVAKSETVNPTAGLSHWTLEADLVLYVHDDSSAGPSALLHTLLDRIEAALEAQPGEARSQSYSPATTLNGVVQSAQISGAVELDEGILTPQALAIIPIEISA